MPTPGVCEYAGLTFSHREPAEAGRAVSGGLCVFFFFYQAQSGSELQERLF